MMVSPESGLRGTLVYEGVSIGANCVNVTLPPSILIQWPVEEITVGASLHALHPIDSTADTLHDIGRKALLFGFNPS
jgi:hypothetical protein